MKAELKAAKPLRLDLKCTRIFALAGPFEDHWFNVLTGRSKMHGDIHYNKAVWPLADRDGSSFARSDFPVHHASLSPHVWADKNVKENIIAFAPQTHIKRRLDGIIHTFKLEPILHTTVDQLDHEALVRAALARAILMASPLYTFTGSFKAFSPEQSQLMATAIKKMNHHFELAMLWRTPRPTDILQHADTLLWTYSRHKPPKKIAPRAAYHKPQTRQLLHATGDAVIFHGTVSQTAETVESAFGSFVAPSWCKPKQLVDIAVRPENLNIHAGHDGFIMSRQTAGRETWLRIELVDGQSFRCPFPTQIAEQLEKEIAITIKRSSELLILPKMSTAEENLS